MQLDLFLQRARLALSIADRMKQLHGIETTLIVRNVGIEVESKMPDVDAVGPNIIGLKYTIPWNDVADIKQRDALAAAVKNNCNKLMAKRRKGL